VPCVPKADFSGRLKTQTVNFFAKPRIFFAPLAGHKQPA
jgi:hypothetical protein